MLDSVVSLEVGLQVRKVVLGDRDGHEWEDWNQCGSVQVVRGSYRGSAEAEGCEANTLTPGDHCSHQTQG
jgi:hypothetical protein